MHATTIATLLVILFIFQVVDAGQSGATCCNVNPGDGSTSCCQSNCPCWGNGGGAGRRNVVKRIIRGSHQVRDVDDSPPFVMTLPCRFDCRMFNLASTSGPLFDSCFDSIVSYTGDYFMNNDTGKLTFRCFDPKTWQDYVSTPGKLAQVINICQSTAHGCLKDSEGGTYNTENESEIPSWTDLLPVTTYKMYQWYAQYKSMLNVLGFMRCPTGYTGNITMSSTACPTVSPVQYFPAISLMKNVSDESQSCTAGSVSCGAFAGQSTTPYSSSNTGVLARLTSTYIARKLLALTYSVFPDVVNTRLDCLTPDIDITSSCLV